MCTPLFADAAVTTTAAEGELAGAFATAALQFSAVRLTATTGMGMRSKIEATSKPATISKLKTGKVVMFGSPAASGPISVLESKMQLN